MGNAAVPDTWQAALDAWEGWLKAGGAPATTMQLRLYQLRRFAADHPDTPPWQVTLDDLVLWLARHDGWRPNTLRTYRGALRAFYAWAVAVGHVERSPAAPLPQVKTTRGLPRPCPDNVLRTGVAEADERLRLILRIAADGGLRRAEVAGLRRDNLWQDGGSGWWLRVHGKGDKFRDVPISDRLAAQILAQPPGWLFPNGHGGPLTPAHLGVLVRRVLPPGWTLHTLRHRFATQAHDRGADVAVIAELLGHANLENVLVYTRLAHARLRRAVEGAA